MVGQPLDSRIGHHSDTKKQAMSINPKILQSLLFVCLIGLLSCVSTAGQQDVSERLTKLNVEVAKLTRGGKYSEALPLARRALELSEKTLGPAHPNVATALNNLALLYRDLGDYAQAIPLMRRALVILEKALGPEHPNVGAALNNLAELYHTTGDYAQAEPLYQRAFQIDEAALGPNHPSVAGDLNNLAELYRDTGNYAQAEPLNRRSLAILEQALGPEHPSVATSLNNLAELYRNLGDYAQAELLNRRALAIKETALGPAHPGVAISLNNLAAVYDDLGDYAQAEPLYRRSLAIREKALGPKHPNVAFSLNNLALLYANLGDFAQAEPLNRRALAIWEQALGPEHPSVALALNNLAGLYYATGNYAQAEPLLRRSLAIREQALGPEHPDLSQTLNNLAELYRRTGNYAQAEPLYRRSLAILEQALGPAHPDVAASLNNLALLYHSLGDYAQAEPLYRRSLAIREQALGSEHPSVAQSLNNLATLVAGQKKYPTALGLLQRGLRIQSRQLHNIFSFTTERQKLAFLHTISGYYEVYLSLLHQQFITDPHVVNQGLALVLQRKGIVLDAQSRIRTAMKGRLSEAAQTNWERLSALQSQQSQLVLNRPKNLALETYRQQLATLQTEIQTIEQTLARESAIVAKDLKQRAITVEAVARRLPEKSVLVEFTKIHDFDFTKGQWKPTYRYLAFVLTKAGTVTLVDLGVASSLETQAQRVLEDVRDSVDQPQRSLESLAGLYTQLWGPLELALTGVDKILLSPDGLLNLVPFAALVDAQGRSLVERYRFAYVSSGREVIQADGTFPPRDLTLLLVANPAFDTKGQEVGRSGGSMRSRDFHGVFAPLPGTQREAREIPPLIPGPAHEKRILVGSLATENAVKSAHSARILHFATHGFFLADQPPAVGRKWRDIAVVSTQLRPPLSAELRENPLIRSGLALAGANHAAESTHGEDGILTALEITALDLYGTELVVLSACKTGVGEVKTGEGVFGLRRAFALAGAQNLLMSLWAVEDETTVMQMTAFYRNLRTLPPAEALRQAQLETIAELREKYGQAAPILWAPFILQGGRALTQHLGGGRLPETAVSMAD